MITIEPITYFTRPKTPRQRQYEALRAYFLERLPQKVVAERFEYSINTFQSLASDFQNGRIEFFPLIKPGPKERQTPENICEKIIDLRKQNRSIYDIQETLLRDHFEISEQTIHRILKDEGFFKLPRRTRTDLKLTKTRMIEPPVATSLNFNLLNDYRFECQVGGIYYFIPYILKTNLYELILKTAFPETSKLSKINSIFSILALKLIGHERLSRISEYGLDTGFGFFAGLNVPPKSTATSTYSYLVDKETIDSFLFEFTSNMNKNFGQFYQGETINLDFHAIPHYGEQSQLDENWVGSKHQSMKSASTFLAQDGESKMLIYENTNIDKKGAPNEILNFVKYWLRVKGIIKQTLVFDSKLTTYGILEQLDHDKIKFITLRRRGKRIVDQIATIPEEDWVSVDLKKPKRKYNKFKIYEETITLPRTNLEVRQLIFKDQGREQPTFLITNNYDLEISTLALNYSNRWLIENKISEIVDFFNLNALSSPFMIRIYFDVALTVVADTLYRLLARELKRFEKCTPKTIFSDFINCSSKGNVIGNEVTVKLKKKKTTPIFKSQNNYREVWKVPWWGNKMLRYSWYA